LSREALNVSVDGRVDANMLWLLPALIPPESFTLHPGEDSKTTRRMNHITKELVVESILSKLEEEAP